MAGSFKHRSTSLCANLVAIFGHFLGHNLKVAKKSDNVVFGVSL
jgi:hypothetical protein